MKKNICALILSYDKYLHLAEINYLSVLKYWPDNKIDFFYMSNFQEFSKSYQGIRSLKVGEDISWSKSLKIALSKLKEDYEYVLTLIDDSILTSKVDNSEIEKILNEFFNKKGDFIKLINKPKPTIKANQLFGEIKEGTPYRATTIFSVWRIYTLLDLIIDDENAWEFEKKCYSRIPKGHKFYSVYKSKFKFYNTVVKGKYQWGFKNILKDLNVDSSILPEIKYFNLKDFVKRRYLRLRHKTYMFLIDKYMKL